jgi:hypothetical protein
MRIKCYVVELISSGKLMMAGLPQERPMTVIRPLTLSFILFAKRRTSFKSSVVGGCGKWPIYDRLYIPIIDESYY